MGWSDCCSAEIKWGDICCQCGDHCEELEDCDEYEERIKETLDRTA